MLGPRNLRVSDEWYTRFRVAWDPAPSRVTGYKLIYQPEGAACRGGGDLWRTTFAGTNSRHHAHVSLSGTADSQEVFVGDVTSHQLHNLKPGTTYDLKVLAQYSTGVSEPLLGQGTTRTLITLFYWLTGLSPRIEGGFQFGLVSVLFQLLSV